MRGKLAHHLESFIKQVNVAIAEAKDQGIVPTPELARERLDGLAAFVTDIPEIAYAKSVILNSDETAIHSIVYSPDPSASLPTLVFFHGGGHMCGSAKLYDPMCRKIAIASQCVVISVDYRLAPEHPYPAGLVDAEYIVRNYQQLLEEVKVTDDLMIAGDSAGGAICTSLSMLQAKDDTLKINKQILLYPSVDYTMSFPSMTANGTGYFLEQPRIKWYFEHYFNSGDDARKASPVFGPMNDKLPETLLVVAGCDPLRDEGLEYGKRLADSGVHVETKMFEGMIHAFMNIEDLVPEECAELYKTIGQFVSK